MVRIRHGLKTKYKSEYRAWINIKARCLNSKDTGYKYYGGRGIYICDKWEHSFVDFIKDVGPKPNPGLTIDRINNNIGYEPGNCRWVSMKVQCSNRRNSLKKIVVRGTTKTLREWTIFLGYKPNKKNLYMLKKYHSMEYNKLIEFLCNKRNIDIY